MLCAVSVSLILASPCAAQRYEDLDPGTPLNDWLIGTATTERTGVAISGWLDQGFTFNPSNPAGGFNGYVTNNDRANEYQLNQLYLAIGKELDPESDGWETGFRVTALYGTDAEFFQSLGWDDHIVSDDDSRFYKLALPECHADVMIPIGSGLTISVGKWLTLVGYENGLDAQDFFYSRSLEFFLTPYTHTGILATYDLNDRWTTSQAIHLGSDVWDDNNNNLAYLGTLEWTAPSEDWSLYLAVLTGPEQDESEEWQDLNGASGPDAPGESLFQTATTATVSGQLTDRLAFAVDQECFFQQGGNSGAVGKAEAYGGALYLYYDLALDRRLGMRFEVLRDDDGFVTAGDRSGSQAAPGVYSELTLGINARLNDRAVARPEIRWDWQDRDNPNDVPAFDDGTSTRQFLAAVDVVWEF